MTSLRALFEWVDTFDTSIAIRESTYVYPGLLTAHVVGMCLFAGLIIMMDLRLMGIGNMRTPFSQVQKRLFPGQMIGMGISTVTGLLLVYGQPMRFYFNIFFWVKAEMMVLLGINALAFHWTTYRSVSRWDTSPALPFGAKVAGGVSIVLWACVVMAGRMIAYNWFKPV